MSTNTEPISSLQIPDLVSDTIPPQPPAELPFVSVVMPCRNEEKHIRECLNSILANDYPHDRLEILVVDGMSQDRTREIVGEISKKYPFVRLVDNPRRIIPVAMNVGIANALGSTIIKMDGHSTYQPHHISRCVAYQEKYGAENVGGVWRMVPGSDTTAARAIVLALGHKFGSGNAKVKVGVSKPTWSDTTAFGCFKKDMFAKVGLYDERLASSSDIELNYRIRRFGGRILIVPDVVIDYRADANIKAYWKHLFADGVWATYVLKFVRKAWSWRHWVPLGFILSLLVPLALSVFYHRAWLVSVAILSVYLAVNISVSAAIAIKERSLKLFAWLPLVFAIRHIAHGLGALLGLVLVVTPGTHWKGRRGAKV